MKQNSSGWKRREEEDKKKMNKKGNGVLKGKEGLRKNIGRK